MVSIENSDSAHQLSVLDDGSGFDPERVDAGFGIVGMRERAELAGGTLAIDSAPGKATRVLLRIPVAGSEPPSP